MKCLLKTLLFLGIGAVVLAIVPLTRVRVDRADSIRLVGSPGVEPESHWSTTDAASDRSGEPTRRVVGRVSATEERARADARRELEAAVRSWLDPQVPVSWRPPGHLVDEMIRETRLTPEEKDYGTVYTASLAVDFSPPRRDRFLDAYREEVVRDRLVMLGGGFAFILVCLAGASGYIRADEATRGYYTNRLRLAAAAAVGASGAFLYRMLA